MRARVAARVGVRPPERMRSAQRDDLAVAEAHPVEDLVGVRVRARVRVRVRVSSW